MCCRCSLPAFGGKNRIHCVGELDSQAAGCSLLFPLSPSFTFETPSCLSLRISSPLSGSSKLFPLRPWRSRHSSCMTRLSGRPSLLKSPLTSPPESCTFPSLLSRNRLPNVFLCRLRGNLPGVLLLQACLLVPKLLSSFPVGVRGRSFESFSPPSQPQVRGILSWY